MNGGRLSNDEAFLLGMTELRAQLDAAKPDSGTAERALARIAVRFPEEAEELGALWRTPHQAGCAALLSHLENLHAKDDD